MTWEGSWTSWTLSTLLGIHWIIPLPSAIHQLANDGLSSLIFFWDETIRYIFAGVSIHYSSRTTLSFASTSASELIYILGVEFARNRDSMLPINWSESAGNRPTELRTNCMETAVSIESIDWWLWLGIIVDNFVDREKKKTSICSIRHCYRLCRRLRLYRTECNSPVALIYLRFCSCARAEIYLWRFVGYWCIFIV